jgi:tetratricopeptide (TPR) repeat protein
VAVRAVAVAIAILLASGVHAAHADDKPWVKGVSETDQKTALDLYRDGNTEFVDDHFAQALAKYQEALKFWDHPAVRFNAAICLDNLERPLEAYEFMRAAMRFGPDPIGKDHFERGRKLLERLDLKTNQLEIHSKQPDAEVSLDGKRLALVDGAASQRVLVGEHQIVAVKPHYQTETMPVVVHAGPATQAVIDMKVEEAARRMDRRWSRLLPWEVLAAGVVVAGIGGGLYELSNHDYSLYTRDANSCAASAGIPGYCPAGPANSHLHVLSSRAASLADGEYAALGLGGAIAAAGFVMILVNSPHLVSADVERDHVAITWSGRW